MVPILSASPLIPNPAPCSKIVLVLGYVFWKIGRDKNSVSGIRRDLLGRDGRTKVNTYDLDDEEDLVFSLNSEA